MTETIHKVALFTLDENGNCLVLKKKDLDVWILPGGKIEPGESHVQCLKRELMEELSVELPETLYYALTCKDIAAGTIDTPLHLYVYFGFLSGVLVPKNEILYPLWVPISLTDPMPIAKSLRNVIVPYFREIVENNAWGHLQEVE